MRLPETASPSAPAIIRLRQIADLSFKTDVGRDMCSELSAVRDTFRSGQSNAASVSGKSGPW